MLHVKEVFGSLKPRAGLKPVCHHLNHSGRHRLDCPYIDAYVRDLAGNISDIAFISGMIASAASGVAALLCAPRLGKLGDRIGPEKILIAALIISVLLLIPMSFVQTPLQLGILRFLLGAADGALLPAVQTLLVYNPATKLPGEFSAITNPFAISVTSPAR